MESVVLAECMNKTVVEVDGAAALDGELANKGDKTISGGQTWFSSKWNYTGKKTVSATRMRMNTYLKHTDCCSRESKQGA